MACGRLSSSVVVPQSTRAGVVDEVDGAVGVAPQVDAREGLLDVPAAVRLEQVVLEGQWTVVPYR